MPRQHPIWVAVVLAFTITLSACSHTTKPDRNGMDFAVGLAAKAMYKPPSNGEPLGKVVLPNPKLMGCSTSACPPVLPEATNPRAVYPWQVSLDYTNGSVIGLRAFYDEPTSIDDVQTAINERYGQWEKAELRRESIRIWRVEPEHFVIQLTKADTGMIQLIYLTFDARHPTSEKAMKQILDRIANGESQ